MTIQLDRLKNLTVRGQWSLDEFDWDQPLADGHRLSPRLRKEAGQTLLFLAGFEVHAAYIFDLCRRHVADPVAKEIYAMFYDEELRHAEAQRRLARRYGVTEDDVPRAARTMFTLLDRENERAERTDPRALYEFRSSYIPLFELALDTVLLPAVRAVSEDPLQTEILDRIDRDESRHLAMDYWLLEQRGAEQAGQSLRTVLAERTAANSRRKFLRARVEQGQTFIALAAGFLGFALELRELRDLIFDPGRIQRYVERVEKVPNLAPGALEIPTYAFGVVGQRRLLNAGLKVHDVLTRYVRPVRKALFPDKS